MPDEDRRVFRPHVARNKEPISGVLRPRLATATSVVEIGSGTGEHAWHFARILPHLRWQPTERTPEGAHRADAFRAYDPLPNLEPAIVLDAGARTWPISRVDVVYCANVIHISPFAVCEGIARGARRHLVEGGRLIFYGPFKRGGEHTAESNDAFDRDLRRRDSDWGVRELEAVAEAAGASGLRLAETVEMPANNLIVVFERSADPNDG